MVTGILGNHGNNLLTVVELEIPLASVDGNSNGSLGSDNSHQSILISLLDVVEGTVWARGVSRRHWG